MKDITCPVLTDPTYGSVSVSGYVPHSSAHYECNDGYKLKGHGYLKCQEDGTWNETPPTCIRKSLQTSLSSFKSCFKCYLIITSYP